MPAQTQANGPEALTAQKPRRATKREELVASMIAAGNHVGYAHASVSTVIEQAGVSRPTFYDYFRDRDDCFLGALDDVYQRLLLVVRERVGAGPAERALPSALEALIDFAVSEPDAARFLTS